MKARYFSLFALVLFNSCAPYFHDLPVRTCTPNDNTAPVFSKADELQGILDEIVSQSIPGCAAAVYSDEGWWTGVSGFARIEDRAIMQTCHLQYLQSITKTYLAAGILKLFEDGRITLEAPITEYLPQKYSRHISGARSISVRMLLNHTSGVPEYNYAPGYITRLLQHPDYKFKPEEYLQYIDGKSLDFAPGSKYSYRNSNYVILALIADAVTGDHAKYLSTVIFEPLGLSETFYRNDPAYLNYPNLVNSYWDRYGNSILENVSGLQLNNVAAMIGDDGIVATPADAVRFLRGLMEGKILSSATLELMKTWSKDGKGDFTYGLGLDYTHFNGTVAYGHSGGGIGAGCELYYFPEKNLYFFIGINLGTVTESPIHKDVKKTLDKFYEVLLR